MSHTRAEIDLISRLPGLDRLWSITRGRSDVRLAILDGQPDISSLAPQGHNGTEEHATLIHSIISGSRDELVAGIAPNCTVITIPIFDPQAPSARASQEQLASAILEAINAGAQIINVSAAQFGDLLQLSSKLARAIEAAQGSKVLIVAATGNHGCAADTLPASIPGVLPVGAHDDDGMPLIFSNWGSGHRYGVLAPGKTIPGACIGGGVCPSTGTSYATAIVTGVAALLLSASRELHTFVSAADLKTIIIDSCDKTCAQTAENKSACLAGTLDVAKATDRLMSIQNLTAASEEIITMQNTEFSNHETALLKPADQSVARSPSSIDRDVKIAPADCGCSGSAEKCSCAGTGLQLAYAIGRLGISFANSARRDSLWRSINGRREGDLKPISDAELLAIFKKQPFAAQSVIWTLSRSEVPMYAIQPAGAFAADVYKWLVKEWSDSGVEFVSIPGVISGELTLYDGITIPIIEPDLRGMYSWGNAGFTKKIVDARKNDMKGATEAQLTRDVERFFGKIYFAIRNKGLTPQERALNAAATNAFNFSDVITEAGGEGLTLRDVYAETSPLTRPGGDYQDVLLTFFNPRDRQGQAPLRARFTIDVSDTVPVMIGDPVTWYEY